MALIFMLGAPEYFGTLARYSDIPNAESIMPKRKKSEDNPNAEVKSPKITTNDMGNPINLFLLFAKPLHGKPEHTSQIIYLEYVARFASLGWITPTNTDWGNNTWAITAKGHAAFNRLHTKH